MTDSAKRLLYPVFVTLTRDADRGAPMQLDVQLVVEVWSDDRGRPNYDAETAQRIAVECLQQYVDRDVRVVADALREIAPAR